MVYRMRLTKLQRFADLRPTPLTEVAPGFEDSLDTVPDGGCHWSASHALRHGKFSDLNAARSLDAREEIQRAARGPSQPRRPIPPEENQALDARLAQEREERERVRVEIEKLEARAPMVSVRVGLGARAERRRWEAKTKRFVLVSV